MSEKHTPGPWTIEPYNNHDKNIIIIEPGCSVDNDDVDHAEAAANARLIAAAPDLLQHVRAQHDVIDTLLAMLIGRDREFLPTRQAFWPTIARTVDLLAKATGGAS